jgi:hypothetical protein
MVTNKVGEQFLGPTVKVLIFNGVPEDTYPRTTEAKGCGSTHRCNSLQRECNKAEK